MALTLFPINQNFPYMLSQDGEHDKHYICLDQHFSIIIVTHYHVSMLTLAFGLTELL